MGEKVYKPIVKEGDHLIRSKDNPDRVRGLTRDENNQNPDIIEWEEYDVEDLRCDSSQQNRKNGGAIIVDAALGAVATIIIDKVVFPWLKDTALPWLKEKVCSIKDTVNEKKELEGAKVIKAETTKENAFDIQLAEVSSEIDNEFERFRFEMDEDEAKAHVMRLVYHMLGVANEIRIITNARIRKDCESKELCIERQNEADKFLSEKVAVGLDQLLSNENLQLDLNTSKELFLLTGGGIHHNGEYIPVQAIKIDKALKEISVSDS